MVNLRVQDLSFRYSGDPVFSGISLSIEKGEILSIVGRNGAGKSTLLKCINHVLKPTAGTVLLEDRDVARMSPVRRAREFGYLPQRSEGIFPNTVFDTVLTGRFPYSPFRFTRQDEEKTAEILERLDLSALAQRTTDRLSGGEQQQVLIARAIAQGADVLLFDEPTNNLDLLHQLRIMRLIRNVARENKITSVLAIHDLSLAAIFSDKVVMLHEGKIFAAGGPAEILTEANIREVFGVSVKVHDHGGVPHIAILG